MKMDLKENIIIKVPIDKPRNEYILEKKNIIEKENLMNYINLNKSIGSTRTTEYSSESGEVISKYKIGNNKLNINKQNTISDNNKNSINKNIIIFDSNKFNNDKSKNDIKNNKNKKAPKLDIYPSEYLNKNNANSKAPKIPLIYDYNFNINNYTNQDKIGDKGYLKKLNNNKEYNTSEEYQKIACIPHDKLLHLCTDNTLYLDKNKDEKNFNEISVTQRIKHKFLTIVYITPKKK